MQREEKVPKIWFLPNGKGGWTPIVSNSELRLASKNIRNLHGTTFEALVPSMSAPSDTDIRNVMQETFKKRKSFLWTKMLAVIGLGVIAVFLGILFSPTLIVIATAISLPALMGLSIQFYHYNNLAYKISAAEAGLEVLGYRTDYHSFLEHLANAIEVRSSPDVQAEIGTSEIMRTGLYSEESYAKMLRDEGISGKMFFQVAALISKNLDESDCSTAATSTYRDLVRIAQRMSRKKK